MNPDNFPLSAFEVDCDGSACGSGRAVGLHVHPPQDGRPAVGRVRVRDHERVGYGPAEDITRLVMGGRVGYMRHNAVIVTAARWAVEGRMGVPAPDVDAFRRSLPEEWQRLVIGPVKSVISDYVTFAFLPDGSKEGWTDSDLGDEYRRQFLALFSFAFEDGSTPFNVLIVDARFGGDEPGAGYEPELVVTVNPHSGREGRRGDRLVLGRAISGDEGAEQR